MLKEYNQEHIIELLNKLEGKQKEEKLSKCIDNIEKRFGKNSIRTGF